MRTKIGLCFFAALLLGANPQTDDAKKELAKLAGTWTVEQITYNAKDHSNLKLNFIFKGDEVIVEGNDRVKLEYARLKFKLDPAATPKIFDVSVGAGIQKGADMEGIYELKDEQLRICLKVFGKDRPDQFDAPGGSSIALLVLKRAK